MSNELAKFADKVAYAMILRFSREAASAATIIGHSDNAEQLDWNYSMAIGIANCFIWMFESLESAAGYSVSETRSGEVKAIYQAALNMFEKDVATWEEEENWFNPEGGNHD